MRAEERSMEENSGASAVWEIDGGVVGPKVGKGQTGLVIPIFCFHCSAIW